ncbi:MAG: homoserine dehydrogenase [Gaiellaceae bacterium]|jgi:predicted homoserine dehydrogenase-like protein
MGRGLVYQLSVTPGADCIAVADIHADRCTAFLDRLGLPYEVVGDQDTMNRAIERGLIAVTDDGELIARCAAVDAVVEATNTIIDGGRHAIATLEQGKHLFLMNSEIDLIFGPHLARLAEERGLVCSSCDGDQYGVLKHLIDELRSWGFELVMAGNIKGFLDRRANPNNIVPEADKRKLDYRMCASYTDGTKLNIEMAIIANAYALRTAVVGMHGPRAGHVGEVFEKFDFEALWRSREPSVDYVLGAEPAGGVFAIGYCEHPYQREMLAYYKMGAGPYYLFYRPYHLCHIEALASIVEAIGERRSILQPAFGFRTNVYAYAKKALVEGDVLDGIGGYSCYGLIDNCVAPLTHPGLPICLALDVVLKRDVEQDEPVLLADVEYEPERYDFALYRRAQEAASRSTT